MAVQLKSALQETLRGWQEDIHQPWHDVIESVKLGFDNVDSELEIEYWEPIFPPRRSQTFPGAPAGAHIFRAFDGLSPKDVRCVILGQDPYPCPAFATGRAFEAGNVIRWVELDKMFSPSVRAVIQLVVAVRTGDDRFASSFKQWPAALNAIEQKEVDLELPSALADRWVRSGVLLLNSSLTLTRFKRDRHPHQVFGHLPVWRPLIIHILEYLVQQDTPVVFIGFGDIAEELILSSRVGESKAGSIESVILRPHPADADRFLSQENPFLLCNRLLRDLGTTPIDW